MASKKLGTLIRQARTDAGLTQEQLAKKVKGVTASDISKAERGEKELSQDALKQIAKATGVTQKSLLEAAGSSAAKKATAKTSSGTSMKVTATEKKLLELYRAADSDTRKAAEKLLKGEKADSDLLTSLLGGAADLLSNMGKK